MSKEYKSYKMKGHTLPGINQSSETKNLADGRSPSSPFQHKAYGQPHPINPQGKEQPVGAGHPATAKAHNVKTPKTPTKWVGAVASMAGGAGGAAGGAAGGGGMMSKLGELTKGAGGKGEMKDLDKGGGGTWYAKDR